jgi:hypothetical protein
MKKTGALAPVLIELEIEDKAQYRNYSAPAPAPTRWMLVACRPFGP